MGRSTLALDRPPRPSATDVSHTFLKFLEFSLIVGAVRTAAFGPNQNWRLDLLYLAALLALLVWTFGQARMFFASPREIAATFGENNYFQRAAKTLSVMILSACVAIFMVHMASAVMRALTQSG